MQKFRQSPALFCSGRKTRTVFLGMITLLCILWTQQSLKAAPVSIKFTSEALGLLNDEGKTNEDINDGGEVDPDQPGLITSPTAGEGSVLQILSDGKAGPGTADDPLFMVVTAQTHLDTITGLPTPNDYQAGVIFISKEEDKSPDGKDEGLGVRAFTVYQSDVDPAVGTPGLRQIDSKTGLAKIEGSKDISGDTGPSAYDSVSPNGAPHVDESVKLDFNSFSNEFGSETFYNVKATSVEVTLSKFEPYKDGVRKENLAISILLTDGTSITPPESEIFNSSTLEEIGDGDKLWKLKLSGISLLGPTDLIDSLEIRSLVQALNEDKSHFLISGMTVDAAAVPIPGSVWVLGSLVVGMCGLGKRFRKTRKNKES